MYSLWTYIKRYKRYFIMGSLAKFIESGVELSIPFIMSSVLKKNDSIYAFNMILVMISIVITGAILATIGQYFSARAATAVSRNIRKDLFEKINSLEFYEIDKIGTASLINRLTADVNAIQGAILIFVRIAIRAPFLIIGSIFFAMLVDQKIALIILVCLPFLAASYYFITKKLVPKYINIQKTLDKITLETKEYLDGSRVIRAFNKQEKGITDFNEQTKEYADYSIGAGKMSAVLGPINTFIMNCGVVATVYFVGRAITFGEFELEDISAFIAYMVQIVNALNMITHLTLNFVKASAGNKRVKEVFDNKSKIIKKEESKVILKNIETDNILEFKNVSFEYDTKSFGLKDISFSLKRGQTLGIIGGTGSGKTTLINLIPRFYDVNSGKILLNSYDIKDYSINLLRHSIVVVAQESVVLAGTIYENIEFGDKNLTEIDVREAAKIAQAEEFILKMKDGYNSYLEQNGRNLSGGQKQRISIARGVARKPEILILDDSSSALDFLTESKLKRGLKKLKKTTKIIISQRTSSVSTADKIIVLDNGLMVGEGTHQELLQNCDIYKRIYDSQQK